MSLYPLVHQFVTKAFENRAAIIEHLERTEYWARTLRPELDDALRCAAVAHDIERSEPDSEINTLYRGKSFRDQEALTYHQQRGAEIIGSYLSDCEAPKLSIERISSLITQHEVGGSPDQNFIKDVDSLSFLENNLDYFIEKLVPTHGVNEVISKFQWMYERISDAGIKKQANPYYLNALKKLETIL